MLVYYIIPQGGRDCALGPSTRFPARTRETVLASDDALNPEPCASTRKEGRRKERKKGKRKTHHSDSVGWLSFVLSCFVFFPLACFRGFLSQFYTCCFGGPRARVREQTPAPCSAGLLHSERPPAPCTPLTIFHQGGKKSKTSPPEGEQRKREAPGPGRGRPLPFPRAWGAGPPS